MITPSGFEAVIDQDLADDWEIIETLSELMESENPALAISFAKQLLGADQYKALKDHLRKKDGRVKTTAMLNELSAILNSETLKNS